MLYTHSETIVRETLKIVRLLLLIEGCGCLGRGRVIKYKVYRHPACREVTGGHNFPWIGVKDELD